MTEKGSGFFSGRPKTVEECLDAVYAVGFKNGQIEMRNKVLKSINRDWSLLPNADLVIKLMKKINKLRLAAPKKENTPITSSESTPSTV